MIVSLKTVVVLLILFFGINSLSTQSSALIEQDRNLLKEVAELKYDHQAIINRVQPYLSERPAGDTTLMLGKILLNMGKSYFYIRRPQISLNYLNQSLAVFNQLESKPLELVALAEYHIAGNYLSLKLLSLASRWAARSIATGKQVLAADSTLANEQWLNSYRVMAANIANFNRDFELSEFYVNSVSPAGLFNQANVPDFTNRQLSAIRAQRELQKNNYGEAIKKLEQLLITFSSDSTAIRKIESNLGIIYLQSGNSLQAGVIFDRTFDQLLRQYEQGDSSVIVDLILLYGNRIQVAIDLEQFAKVDTLLQEGLAYARKYSNLDVNFYVGDLYSNASFGSKMQGDVEASHLYLDSAIVHFIEDPTPINETGMVRIKDNVIYNRSRLLTCLLGRQKNHYLAYEQGDLNALRLAVKCHASIDSLLRYSLDQLSLVSDVGNAIKESIKDYEYSMNIALQLFKITGNEADLVNAWKIIAVQKSNLLSRFLNGATLAEALNVPGEITDRKMDLELTLSRLEKEAQTATGAKHQSVVDSVLTINAEVRKINEKLTREFPQLDHALRGKLNLDFKKIKKQLPADLAVLEYFIGNDSSVVFALHKGGIAFYSIPTITDLADKTNQIIKNDGLAQQLYDSLLAGILAQLPSTITRLHIIPDGVLWNLSFAALRNNGRFLIRDYAISYAYSAGLLFDAKLRAEVESARRHFAGFGLSYDSILKGLQQAGTRSATDRDLLNLAGLPYARAEVTAIGKLTRGDTWLDSAATKQNFLNAIPGYLQLHLAMHGLTDPDNPMENALVFASDDPNAKYALFTTREILAQKIPARLAVLSACHTGAGPLESSEGIQSMARAFTFAGVKATLASSWEASDKVTHDILIRFYEEIEKGQPLDRAQQIATLAYLDQASPADQRPELWANLMLTGFTEPLVVNSFFSWWLLALVVPVGICWWWWRRG